MTTLRKRTEVALFLALLAGSLALLGWRWSSLPHGLSTGEAESLVLARAFISGEGLRFTPASSAEPGPSNLVWFLTQSAVLAAGLDAERWMPRLGLACLFIALVLVALRGAVVWRRPVRGDDALPVLALSVATALAEAAALGSSACAWALALTVAAVVGGAGLHSGAAVRSGVDRSSSSTSTGIASSGAMPRAYSAMALAESSLPGMT